MREQNDSVVEFCKSADILIHDAQYTQEEYDTKKGWGHTSMEESMEFARRAKVRDLVFCHHDPERTDEQLTNLLHHYQEILGKEKGCPISNLMVTEEGVTFKA